LGANTAVDAAQLITAGFTVVTGLAAVAAVLVSVRQAAGTAEVNRETIAGLQEAREHRAEERRAFDEERAYLAWLGPRLTGRAPSVLDRLELTDGEIKFFERAVREGYIVPVGDTPLRYWGVRGSPA
jgi:hypothetical protein